MHRTHATALFGLLAVGIFAYSNYSIPEIFTVTYNNDTAESVHEAVATSDELPQEIRIPVRHHDTPESVKAVYMTSWVAGTTNLRDKIIKLVDETEVNSIVIDIKDDTGRISFAVSDPKLVDVGSSEVRIPDIKEFLAFLHSKDIYVIGRLSAFQDPFYSKQHPELAVKRASDGAVWKDYKGLSFIDAGASDYWNYLVDIATESFNVGFDEINFDYIRFPSDGNMRDIYYPFSDSVVTADPDFGKAAVIEDFFSYITGKLRDPERADVDGRMPVLSADLFGMTTTNKDDLNIGQVLERALPYFDYVAPMVYPSHYPSGFRGYNKPATLPYEVVNYSMSEAARRVAEMKSSSTTPLSVRSHVSTDQLRPWIQDFDLGAIYNADMVRAQINATYDAGLDSWMAWDAANTYSAGAYLPE